MSRRDQIALFLLIGSLLGNLGLLFKWQWERETVNSLGYAFEIANAVPKIRHGMSKEEAIRLIGRAPDEETKNEHGNFCSWIPDLKPQPLHRLRYGTDLVNGYYSASIRIDEEEKILEVISGF